MNTQVEQITPEMAARLLKGNTHNRAIRTRVVEKYIDMMNRGLWELTHQGIAIGIDGTILDGQHRLLAIIEAGTTVPMCVTYNVASDIFDSIDLGQTRSIADLLRLPKREVAVYSMLARILKGHNSVNSYDVANVVTNELRNSLSILRPSMSTHTKHFGSAPFTLAGLIRYLQVVGTNKEEYVVTTFHNFMSNNIEALPNVGTALVKQVLSGQADPHNAKAYDFLARGLYVFEKDNATKKRIILPSEGPVQIVKNIWATFSGELPSQ